jgi:hypothetical protein
MMIGLLLNMLFGCSHRQLTRPITPVKKAGVPQGDTYVACLECGQQFAYDLKEMRIGKRIDRLNESSVQPALTAMPTKKKLKYALWISVPAALVVGFVLKSKKTPSEPPPGR